MREFSTQSLINNGGYFQQVHPSILIPTIIKLWSIMIHMLEYWDDLLSLCDGCCTWSRLPRLCFLFYLSCVERTYSMVATFVPADRIEKNCWYRAPLVLRTPVALRSRETWGGALTLFWQRPTDLNIGNKTHHVSQRGARERSYHRDSTLPFNPNLWFSRSMIRWKRRSEKQQRLSWRDWAQRQTHAHRR